MFAKFHLECLAFVVMLNDARQGRAKLISPQTLLALSLGTLLSATNLSRHDASRRFWKEVTVTVLSVVAFTCTWMVLKKSEANGQDDVIIPRWPRWTSKISIYLMTLVLSFLTIMLAGKFSVTDVIALLTTNIRTTVCTFENYLHAFALLPQLVLCRHQGLVSPAATRFLFITGVKDIYEFASDGYVSYRRYRKGIFEFREVSILSGDLLAAGILLDFLYLVVISRNKHLLIGSHALDLPDDETLGDVSRDAKPFGGVKQTFADFSVIMKGHGMKKLVVLAGILTLAFVGAYLQVVNIYAMVSAGLAYAALRWGGTARLDVAAAKAEECCA